jgi:hypothetical protein
MGHKFLLPVDVVLKTENFRLSLGDDTAAFLLNSAGNAPVLAWRRIVFRFTTQNTVGLTASGAQFKRL